MKRTNNFSIALPSYQLSHLGSCSRDRLSQARTTNYQYLLQQLIERGKQLLKQTDRSIMEIALMYGFNSHSHLSKQFRQITGITPKNYRAS